MGKDDRLVKQIADELERRRKAAEWDAWVQRYRAHNDRISARIRASEPATAPLRNR